LYNLLDRSAEREVIPSCVSYGLSLVPYSPLAGGVLTGKYARHAAPPAESRAATFGHAGQGRPGHVPLLNERTFSAVERLGDIARELGTTPARLSIAWVLQQPNVASVILGASRREQIDENVAGLDVRLSPDNLVRVTTAIDG
jgi:aryl-alcohol dehydrogenase-like predicted oxidoreductase